MCTINQGNNYITGICCDGECLSGVAPQQDIKLVIDDALSLIGGERMEHYGKPWDNLADIAAAWTPYVRRALEERDVLTATDVCALMVILKVIRQARGYHRDSTVDVIGYAELAEIVNDPATRDELLERSKR